MNYRKIQLFRQEFNIEPSPVEPGNSIIIVIQFDLLITQLKDYFSCKFFVWVLVKFIEFESVTISWKELES